MSERFLNGDTIPVTVTVLNDLRVILTGLTDILLTIRRNSDDFYLDFDDATFKASGWTTRQQVLGEKNATLSPGVYFYDWDTTGLSNDKYHIEIASVSAANSPWANWVYVGDYIDTIPSDILATVYEDSETLKTLFRLLRSLAAGDRKGFTAGHGGIGEFASIDGSKTRITSPHDASGNTDTNSGITVDGSD